MIPLGMVGAAHHEVVPVWEGVLNTVYVTAPDQTPLVVPASGTPGRLLVSALTVDKNAGHTIGVSAGWTIAARYAATSVSAALAWRIATGSDDIAWTTSASKVASSSVHEWSGVSSSPVISTARYPDPPDDIARSTLTASVNSGGLAVALVTWDTGPVNPPATSFTNGFTVLQNHGFALSGYGPSPIVLAARNFPAGAVAETTAVIPSNDQSTMLLVVFA